MLKAKLKHISDYILAQNTYFDAGYSDVYKNENGHILSGETPVFPADNLGDYFYLRLPQAVTFDLVTPQEDCQFSYNANGAITLVAFVMNADADTLLHNLANTLQGYGTTVRLSRGVYQSEVVVLQELDKENAVNVLANLDKDMTIVSITFNVVQPVSLRCVTKPCTSC